MAAVPSPSMDAQKEARKWKRELTLAGKLEKDWRAEATAIVKRYRGEEKKRNRFNVLWANTEILRPAIYNSRPNPDVRRRFRDADPVGKAVSEVLERALAVFVDGDETDDSLKNDVLDGLLVGRGISRIRYVPTISTVPRPAEVSDPDGDEDDGDDPVMTDDVEQDEELDSETVCIEHVEWQDFRHGFGRTWPEVPWEGFRHKLSRAEAEEKFGKDALGTVQFTTPESDDPKKSEEVGETQKLAEFWEIWDKVGKRVFFTQDALDVLLFPLANPDGEPPLELDGFFPNPRPLQIVENTGSLMPTPIFRLYEDQANQIERITQRIDKIVNTMRLRGVYDARLSEMADLLSSDDNEMVPVQNAQQWGDGGLDKAISWVPVEKNAEILTSLYEARDRQKAIIDELLGISDIIRGATDPNETATAQNLKSNYGSVRLQRMQKEVQRYARDLLRIAAAAMSQKFSPETFTAMTELSFPTEADKALMQQQMQMQQMQTPPQPGAPPPAPAGPPINPALLQMPTWDDILGVMRSEKRRQYRIDVETDSTIAGTLSSDMAGLSQVLQSISQTLTGLAPLVQDGALPVDAAKEIVMSVIRRARMGIAVEDAFDKMQAPKPPADPNAGKAQEVQAKVQGEIEVAKIKANLDAQVNQAEQQAQQQANQQEQLLEHQRALANAQLKTELDASEQQHKLALEQMRLEAENQRAASALETQRMIADANNQTKLMIAQLTADHATAMATQQQDHEQKMALMAPPATDSAPMGDEAPTAASYKAQESDLAEMVRQLSAQMSRPRRVIRDENGKIAGVE